MSAVRSAYDNRRAMVLGAVVCIFGAVACAVKTGSPIFWTLTAAFVLLTVYRYVDMTLFARVEIEPSDVKTASRWELRATYGAAAWAALAGLWCFASFAIVRDPSTEIIAMVATIGCLVGVVARNFGLDRMLTVQLAIVAAFVAIGLLLRDDPYHWVLAAFMLPMLISYRFLAADVRSILLSAVHGRVEASRLAGELDAALDTMQHALCMLDADGVIASSMSGPSRLSPILPLANGLAGTFASSLRRRPQPARCRRPAPTKSSAPSKTASRAARC